MAYTEFYCDAATGSNLNGGSTTGSPVTYASGSWVQSTGVFTVASGDPTTDVAVGDFASVYADGATVTGYVGRVTARTSTTITVSLSACSGTAPTDGTSNRTIKIGGPWKGPNGTDGFPFTVLTSACNNGTDLVPRTNFKNNATYSVTAALTAGNSTLAWEGYATTVGDGGRATIDGGTGSAYNLLAVSGNQQYFTNLRFNANGNSGGSGTTHGVNVTGARCVFRWCVCSGMRGNGFHIATPAHMTECEAWDNNKANSTGKGGFSMIASGSILTRCYSHHNAGSNGNGFYLDTTVACVGCISHTNGKDGFFANADQHLALINCDAYNNGGSGLNSQGGSGTLNFNVQNCNFVKNGRYGIECGSGSRYGLILNCAFGAGTEANTLGEISTTLFYVYISGNITYPSNANPWVDPANGDFRITLAQAKNAGRGNYLQVYGESAPNTAAYPDIGAGQHLDAGGSGGIKTHPGMAGGMRG